MKRDDDRNVYVQRAAPAQRASVVYTDPVRTDEERRQRASKLAKQEAALRRAKLAERWIVFTVAGMLAIAMLPVLVVVAAIAAAAAIWRRSAQWLKPREARVRTEVDGLCDSPGDRIARRRHADLRDRAEREPLSYATDADAAPEIANA